MTTIDVASDDQIQLRHNVTALRRAATYFGSCGRFTTDVIASVLRRHVDHLEANLRPLTMAEAQRVLTDAQKDAARRIADAQSAIDAAQRMPDARGVEA